MSRDITIAFNTANLVGHYSGYRIELSEWMKQHTLTAERTGFPEWEWFARQIRAAGFDAIEVWVALVEKLVIDGASATRLKGIWRDAGLCAVALAGPLNDATGTLCSRLDIPAACGGYWGSDPLIAARVMRQTGILFNYENHPERNVEEIRKQAAYGANGFAVALDTGWLGTQGVDAPAAVRELGRLIRHVHLKDVSGIGSHQCVPLGSGCVDITGVLRELRAIGYSGVLSWEDEPENRNPFDIATDMHDYIAREWAGR